MKTVSNNGNSSLSTVTRAMRVLETLAEASAGQGLPVKRLAEDLDLNLSTTYNLVRTLLNLGYITKSREGLVRIGPAVAPLYQALLRQLEVGGEALDVLRSLSEVTGETSFFSTWENGSMVLRALVQGSQPLSVTGLYVGLTGSEHARGSGKVLLAVLDQRDRDRYFETATLEPRTRNTITTRAALEKEFREILSTGYALDREEFADGISCIAAPYYGGAGIAAGAISVAYPTIRHEDDEAQLIDEILAHSRMLSRMAGHREVEKTT